MKLKDLLDEDQLKEIKKIGYVSDELKTALHSLELNTETQKILMQIVDEDAEDLIKSIVDDVFFEYMNKKTKTDESEQ